MIRFRPATEEAVRKVFGRTPPRSMRGVVFEHDGEPVACAGLYVEAGHQVIFFDGNHALVRTAPVTAIKAAKYLMRLAERTGLPMLAHADEDQERSERLLEHLGFRREEGRTFRWDG